MMTTKTASEPFPVSDNVAKMRASSTMAAMMAAEAMRQGKTKYTPVAGTRDLQQAIINFYEQEFGAAYAKSAAASPTP